MRARETRYAVAGWGRGVLWTAGGVVLAHDFAFDPVSDTRSKHRTPLAELVPSSTGPSGAGISRRGAPPACGEIGALLAHSALDSVRCLTPEAPEEALVGRFRALLAGERVAFGDVLLDLSWCSPFQRAVALALRGVPWGEVVSYGELAALAGYPGAARAAGTFCARNRFAFLLPCHRVVAADGIGSYGAGGVAVKRRLLALEGVRL